MRPTGATPGGGIPELDHPLATRVAGAAARTGRLAVNGRSATARGTAAEGLDSLALAGHGVARGGPRPVGATSEAVLLSPLGWERRLRLVAGTLVERVAADHEDPVIFCEWRALDDLELRLAWTPVRPSDLAAFRFDREPDELIPAAGAQRDENGEALVAVFRLAAGDGLRLVAALAGAPADTAGSGGDDRGAGLASSSHSHQTEPARGALLPGDPAARIGARAVALTRAASEGLRVRPPDRALGDALAWAVAVLDACESGGAGTWVGLAALAVGRFEVGAALAADADRGLVGVASWTGRGGGVREHGPGDPLQLHADDVTNAPGGPALAAYLRGDAEVGFERWHEIASAGPRADRLPASAPDGAWATAVTLPFVHGLLGASPDATLQRLRLRPRLPPAWDRLELDGLRLGDAGVAMRYRRDGGRHEFAFDQETGSVPLTLLFEPALPGSRLIGARVDGRDAVLDALAARDRIITPVQLVLDHRRTIELDVG